MIKIREIERDPNEKIRRTRSGREYYSTIISVKDKLYDVEPLLDYVKEITNKIFAPQFDALMKDPEISISPNYVPSFHGIFASRYISRDIKIFKESQNRYAEDEEVLSALLAYGLDLEKFWYLLVWVKDYVDSCTLNVPKYHKSPAEELMDFVMYIKPIYPPKGQEYNFPKETGSIKVKIGKRRCLELKNPYTLKVIEDAIQLYMKEHNDEQHSDLYRFEAEYEGPIDLDDNDALVKLKNNIHTLPEGDRMRRFFAYYYLKLFFKGRKIVNNSGYVEDFFPDTEERGVGVDTGIDWLISRLIHIIAIAQPQDHYYDPYNHHRIHDDGLDKMKIEKFHKQGYRSHIYSF